MSKREKNNNPGGSTPSYNNGPYGEAPPWKGFLTHSPQVQVYTASAPGCPGGGAGKGRRACNYASGI